MAAHTDRTGSAVDFMDTPKAYYQALPERLEKLGITNVAQELKELERLQILVDGAEH